MIHSGMKLKSYGYQPDSLWTTNPLFLKEETEYYFYQNDHLGTPQKLVDLDGTIAWAAIYAAFGQAQVLVDEMENNLRFPGQYFDIETGLCYNWRRFYDSMIGRYLKVDPIGFNRGGVNLYGYVGNNPINLIDPWGLKTIIIITRDTIKVLGVTFSFGSHAAVYIENNGDPAMYDPAGSYGNRVEIGTGDLISEANLTDYLDYHRDEQTQVYGFFFPTSASEEEEILERISEMGGGFPGFCALDVSQAIRGIGPFQDLEIYLTPDGFYQALEALELLEE